MGKSLAGDYGRLTLSRGHWPAPISNIPRLPIGAPTSGEFRHAR